MANQVLQALLVDVRDQGSVCIPKKKLLFFLGRANANSSAWQLLLDEWEEVAPSQKLFGSEWSGNIILSADANADIQKHWL